MAEIILSPIIDMLFEKFVSPTFEKLVRYAGIHSEVKKWKKSLSGIRALLIDASQKEITSESIKLWLNSIQHLAYDIEDILDALATEATCRDHVTEESGAITRKNELMDAVRSIDLMDGQRSTLKSDGLSSHAFLTLKDVINDISELHWQECCITSLQTINSVIEFGSGVDTSSPKPLKFNKNLASGSKDIEDEATASSISS